MSNVFIIYEFDMLFKKYSKEDLIEAIKSSITIREVLIKLNIKPHGGNYKTIHKYIKKFEINTDHFLGQGWGSGKTLSPKRPIEDYLTNKKSMTSSKLRKRLIKENIFECKCSKCGLSEWQGQPIPLELDHINGDHEDNSLENLRLLCPNCHAQTPTYRRSKKSLLNKS